MLSHVGLFSRFRLNMALGYLCLCPSLFGSLDFCWCQSNKTRSLHKGQLVYLDSGRANIVQIDT